MDLYFIVAELDFPEGTLDRWLYGSPSTADVLEGAEGDVVVTVDGGRFSLRTFLIDGAYFGVKDALHAAFARAEAVGATGKWYSGDHVSGTLGVLGGRSTPAMVHQLADDVSTWVKQAGELGARSLEGDASASPKKTRARSGATSKTKAPSRASSNRVSVSRKKKVPVKTSPKSAKPSTKKTPAKKVAKKAPAKVVAKKAPAKKAPAKKAPAKKAPAKKAKR